MQYKTGVEIEVLKEAIQPFKNVLVVDDCMATGGTLSGMKNLLEQSGAALAGIVTLSMIKACEEASSKVIEGVSYANLIFM